MLAFPHLIILQVILLGWVAAGDQQRAFTRWLHRGQPMTSLQAPFSTQERHAAAGVVAQQQLLQLAGPAVMVAPLKAADYRPLPGGSRFPRLIHQTVRDKHKLSCQQRDVMRSWQERNPGYHHLLWDDHDMRAMVARHYPAWLHLYDGLLLNIERSDVWRYLVLHKYGGVYADVDVRCMTPIAEWNANHRHDADVLAGVEFLGPFTNKSAGPAKQFNQWAMAATPGHPIFLGMMAVTVHGMAHQFLQTMRQRVPPSRLRYERGVLGRTGPEAWTRTIYQYMHQQGFSRTDVTYSKINATEGFIAGGVRLLPVRSLSLGWQVAEARSKQWSNVTCDTLASAQPDMLACHEFFGSWKSEHVFGKFKPQHEYAESCGSGAGRLYFVEPQALDPGLAEPQPKPVWR